MLDHRPTPALTWDGEGLGTLRDWTVAVTGQWIGFGRMERLAGQLTHARQGERVVAWRERPYQNGYPTDDLTWYCAAYGIEAGPMRLETMRRLVLYLAAQKPLVLEPREQERKTDARTA